MRVLSGRSLSLRAFFCSARGSFGSSICNSSVKLCIGLSLCLAGCVSKAPHPVFVPSGLSEAEWKRARKECDYEAEKATGSAPINIRYYRWESLYISCLELRGVKYLGISNQLPKTQ